MVSLPGVRQNCSGLLFPKVQTALPPAVNQKTAQSQEILPKQAPIIEANFGRSTLSQSFCTFVRAVMLLVGRFISVMVDKLILLSSLIRRRFVRIAMEEGEPKWGYERCVDLRDTALELFVGARPR